MRWTFSLWLLGSVAVTPAAAQVPISDEPTAVFVMKVDGTEVRKVAQVEHFRDHGSPRWSHDGKRLVFDAGAGRHGPRKCFVVNVDGSGLAELCDGELPDWSPDDKQIAYQSSNVVGGLPEIYVQNLDGKGRLKIATGYSPRWSPDGSQIAISDRRMLRVVDLLSDETTPLFDRAQGVVFNGCAWSPDGKQLAVVVAAGAPGPRQLVILDAAGNNRNPQPRLTNQLGGLVSFSPDGTQIVFSNDFQLQVVDVDGMAPPQLLPGQEGQNRYPVFSPDGQWIAFTSTRKSPEPVAPKKAATPHSKKFQEVRRHHKGTIVYGLAFTPDGSRLVMGCDPKNKGIQVWDMVNDTTREIASNGIRIEMFPDGRRFATAWHHPIAQIFDLASGKVLREIDHGDRIWAFALSRDGKRLLTGGLDKIVTIWDVETGKKIYRSKPYADWITRAAFSPDGSEAIIATHDHMLRVFNAETGQERLAIEHPAAVWGLAVAPDGRQILTGTGGSLTSSLAVLKIAQGPDNVLRSWDVSTGQLVHEMKGHSDVVYAIDVSPDSHTAVTGGSDGTMRLWDLASGDELCTTKAGEGRVPFVAFSPDGREIAAGGGARRINNVITEFPNEQVRLYKIVDADGPTAQR